MSFGQKKSFEFKVAGEQADGGVEVELFKRVSPMFHAKSVLFVCWGNVCRSPAAEKMLKKSLRKHGAKHLRIESAGVCADGDTPRPSFSMWLATLLRGIWLRPTPRMLRKNDLGKYDLIVAMDRDVFDSITLLSRSESVVAENVRLLSEYLPQGAPVDVPDPMNQPFSVCNRALNMLEQACSIICNQLVQPRRFPITESAAFVKTS